NDLAANDYYQFGFNTTRKYLVDELTVGLRSSNTGPGFVDLLYSKDGGAFVSLTSTNPIELVGTNFNNLTANLSEIGRVNSSLILKRGVHPATPTTALSTLNQPADSTIGANGTFRFASFSPSANVFLNPELKGTAVPEPASVALFGL